MFVANTSIPAIPKNVVIVAVWHIVGELTVIQ